AARHRRAGGGHPRRQGLGDPPPRKARDPRPAREGGQGRRSHRRGRRLSRRLRLRAGARLLAGERGTDGQRRRGLRGGELRHPEPPLHPRRVPRPLPRELRRESVVTIRLATEADVARILEISNAAIATTANFALAPEPLAQWLETYRNTRLSHP